MRLKSLKFIFFSLTVAIVVPVQSALADAISPNIQNGDKVYSTEKPNAAYFGTGVAGRLSEASRLRFEGEHYTINGEFDTAIRQLKKAVELDPGYPEGHVLLARAMTKKIKKSDVLDKKLFKECRAEWSLIDKHDADHTHQFEARRNLRFLHQVARSVYEKEHPNEKKKRSLFAKSKGLLKKLKRKDKVDSMEFTL